MNNPVHTSGIVTAFLTGLFVASSFIPASSTAAPAELSATELAKSDLDQRMAWFNDARFGLFIHWGIYSTLGGEYEGKKVPGYAEWIQAKADIPSEKYTPLSKVFDPQQYDPEQWVLAAKAAGMKYVVITTKHHDGFCMWPSDATTYDIDEASPFKRDILGELAAACKKHGLKFGTYYSIIDWHHPSQTPNLNARGSWARWGRISMKEGRKQEYVAYMKAQIKELIEKYDTEILWFDGDWTPWWTLEDGDDLYRYIRSLKPSIIINNRVSKRGTFKYDFGTPENSTPGAALDHYWEACWTMNHTWGFSKHDHSWKSDRVLIQKLVDIASKGGNLLLNIGPKPDGTLQKENYSGLGAMGDWMVKNAESIYGTKFTPIRAAAQTRLTAKGDDTLYLHLFSPFDQKEVKLPLSTTKVTAKLLDGGANIPLKLSEKSVTLDLAQLTLSEHVTTIVLNLPEGYQGVEKQRVELKSGDILLNAADAKILGEGPLKLEAANHALGFWSKVNQAAEWRREVVTSGSFDLILVYALDPSYVGGQVTASMSSGSKLQKKLKPTKGWKDFQQCTLGRISLTALQPETIRIDGAGSPAGTKALMNLRGIILRPVE